MSHITEAKIFSIINILRSRTVSRRLHRKNFDMSTTAAGNALYDGKHLLLLQGDHSLGNCIESSCSKISRQTSSSLSGLFISTGLADKLYCT